MVFAQPAFLESINWRDSDNAWAVACAAGGSFRRIAAERLILPRILRRQRLDLLHALSLAAPPSLPCPMIATVHDLGMMAYPQYYPPLRRAYLSWAVQDSTRRARVVIVDSRSVARQVEERLSVPAQKISVIPLGIDPVEVSNRTRRGHVLMLGAGEPRKRADLLAAAYRRATRETGLPELVLAGRSLPQRDETTPHGRIRRRPFLSDADRDELLSTAGLLVSPSLDEGYDLPPHEALARGVPVLLSDIPVHREVFGEDAHYFPAGDAQGLATRLCELYAHGLPPPPPREVVLKWGTRTWRRTAEATAELYRRYYTP
ncbi:glycosyltransferase family 4 protein [bacterium]|nr:glycosyltransferase family 4 protein [bacterium]